jgi:hypothetical protein
LYSAGKIYWNLSRGAMAFDATDSVLSIIFDTFPGNRPGTGPTVLVRVKHGVPISTDTVFPMGMPIYMAIAGHEGSIQVAYVDWHRDYRATRLQVVSSRDAGETWSAPVVLNPDTERNVTGTWIFASPTGDLHVLWIETAGDLIFGSASLHHAWRSSGSTEWQEESPFPLPVGMGHSVAAVDPCGGLHRRQREWGPRTGLLPEVARWLGPGRDPRDRCGIIGARARCRPLRALSGLE